MSRNVFAVITWSDEDVHEVMNKRGIEITDKNMEIMRQHARVLVDRSIEEGWDILDTIVQDVFENKDTEPNLSELKVPDAEVNVNNKNVVMFIPQELYKLNPVSFIGDFANKYGEPVYEDELIYHDNTNYRLLTNVRITDRSITLKEWVDRLENPQIKYYGGEEVATLKLSKLHFKAEVINYSSASNEDFDGDKEVILKGINEIKRELVDVIKDLKTPIIIMNWETLNDPLLYASVINAFKYYYFLTTKKTIVLNNGEKYLVLSSLKLGESQEEVKEFMLNNIDSITFHANIDLNDIKSVR